MGAAPPQHGHYGGVTRVRSWLRALFRVELAPNAKCPVCGEPVVAYPVFPGPPDLGGRPVPRTREELIGACAVHGRPPFNDKTRR